MKNKLFVFCFLLISTTTFLKAQSSNQNTWTYTYLKATSGQKDNLKEFLKKNWFAMDSIAVRQGLFNDYELIENINKEDSLTWDFIVAVEYFTSGTYADVAEKWQVISKAHQTVKVNGLSFKDLGKIVKSETIKKNSDIKNIPQCIGKQFEILKPFLGNWEEYTVEDGKEQLFGRLTITLNAEGCSLNKRFLLYNRKGSYLTSGYYDLAENAWIETFTFRNGDYSKYKWVVEGKEVVMVRIANSSKSDYLNRNRWTNITSDSFDILEERSYDSGKKWTVYSTTKLKRK
ncbi:MAG: hypothetical protein IM591_16200 [Chitinophagaceae bacterium]|nr:hypothetical protein [Bacteroidota bacterium]MCA6471915.1 hypothetical protein [Chitinophagaceae bacterium]MCA6516488.1 hypothetical protein [Chitinophagaceae bacterium]